MLRRIFKVAVVLGLLLILAVPWFLERSDPLKAVEDSREVALLLHDTNEVISLSLEEYVVGVVAAEMPASFPLEALKAQAVSARTYVLKRMGDEPLSNPVHEEAVACDNPQHFQAWISKDEMKEKWGTLGYYDYYYKVAKAVQSTVGEVLVYEGELIDPVYHSSCGGEGTINAKDVWSFDIPYLKSVACPYDADPKPIQKVVLSTEEVISSLQLDQNYLAVSSGGNGLPPFEVIETTSLGRPKTIDINGEMVSALTLRDYLGLRSANFEITPCKEGLEIETIGYGHGVGMCQYGAKGFAEEGKTYQEILGHYYTGVSLEKY